MSVDRENLNSFPHDRWFTWVATSGGIGLIPKAPGTWGSLPGVALGVLVLWLSAQADSLFGMILIKSLVLGLASILGYITIKLTEEYWNTHDNKRIVVDEVLGQAVAICFVSIVWWQLVLAFVLFRFFDILKPGPIGWLDKYGPGATGTLGDDMLAGLTAGLVCLALLHVFA